MNNHHLYFLFLAAIAPVIAGLGYIFTKDRYNKEPARMLIGAFLMGIATVIPICIVEIILTGIGAQLIPENNRLLILAWLSFIVAAVTEECFKLLFLYAYIWNSPEFDERFDGIVYGVFISLGFACAENLMYIFGFLSNGIANAYTVSLSRAAFTIPLHFFCGVILGYYLSLAKFERIHNTNSAARERAIFKGLFYAILFHGLFDFILFYFYPDLTKDSNDLDLAIQKFAASVFFAILFLVFNILFWKFCYKRICHMANLLTPNPQDEQSALIKCSHCGTTYTSDLYACPNCKQLTSATLLAQNAPNNDLENQDLHNLNSFPSNHEVDSSPKNPYET